MKYKVTLGGKNYEVEVERGEAVLLGVSDAAAAASMPAAAAPAQTAPQPDAAALSGGEALNAPMPGSIISIAVSPGQRVKKGDVLLLLEAMKMENEIAAPRDATVARIIAQPGASVSTGDPLLVLV